MKKRTAIAWVPEGYLTVLCCLVAAMIFPARADLKENIAVLNLNCEFVDEATKSAITDKIAGDLLETGHFRLIERSRIEEVIKEQGFQNSGCTSDICAIRIGKILNVGLILTGNLGRLDDKYLLSLRIVDIKTAEVLAVYTNTFEKSTAGLITHSIPLSINNLLNRYREEKLFDNGPYGCGELLNIEQGRSIEIRMTSGALIHGTIQKNGSCLFLLDKGPGGIATIRKKYVRKIAILRY